MTSTKLYDEFEAADFLGRSVGTLRRYRCLNTKPHYLKQGRHVRYAEEALLEYLAAVQDLPKLVTCLEAVIEEGRDPDGSNAAWLERLRKDVVF